ncbi:MAG TPA: GNAT family N-acetyltransferase [Pyrinomonadaceae bacterium]|nr:GNAT family N-acetyltransferase [Pyrinomonadaceae bacterium]
MNSDVQIHLLETERLVIRELDAERDAAFILDLLNQPSFIKNIGDRGVRTVDESRDFIENRYRQSYRDHGYGLYSVELKSQIPNPESQIGICGFVRRPGLDGPDIGFAFLPQFERQGFALESATAMMRYGAQVLGFTRVFAITTLDNAGSIRLLEKLGFEFEKIVTMGESDEKLRLFSNQMLSDPDR